MGTVVTAPCCLRIYPSALLHTTGVQTMPRERAACLDPTGSGVTAQVGRQDVMGLPALATPKPRILQVSGLNRISSSEWVKRAQGPYDGL